MFNFNPTIFLFLLTYSINYSLAANRTALNCKVENTIPNEDEKEKLTVSDGVLNITYERSELGVYKYPNTNSVNILISDAQVKYKGELISKLNSSRSLVSSIINTTIEGTATLTENDTLTDCDLEIKTNNKQSMHLSTALQDKIFYLGKSCTEIQLCEQFDKIVQDDILRAQIDPHDFGENSVLYSRLHESFRNLDFPTGQQSQESGLSVFGNQSKLQTSLNIVLDFLLTILINQVSGKELGIINLPNMNDSRSVGFFGKGYFNLANGTFGNLKNIFRTENFDITNDGLRFKIKLALQLPQIQIKYDHYYYYLSGLSSSGGVAINIDSVTIAAEIVINYNVSPCRASLSSLRSKIEGVSFQLLPETFLKKVVKKTVNITINFFTRNIVGFIKLKLKNAIRTPLESLNCESYRPS